MRKRNLVRVLTLSLAALGVLVAFTAVNTRNMLDYRQRLEVSYQQSLSEFSECADAINTDLTKSLYSNSPSELRKISRDLYAQCSVAKNAVSRLPVSQTELDKVYKFLSQAGDYAQYLEAKAEIGKISEAEHKNLNSLLDYSSDLTKSANGMMNVISSGARITNGSVKGAKLPVYASLDSSFSRGAKTFENYPSLIYDGPFSDSVINKSSELLKESEGKTKNACRSAVSGALKVSERRVIYDGDSNGKLACYNFKSGFYTVSVTKRGGYINTILYSQPVNQRNIGEAEAVKLAENYIKQLGYGDMAQTYYAVSDNVCTVNFAYAKDGVYCYADLIKVSVSMDDGKLTGFDASTYIMNHRQRSAFPKKADSKEAESRLSPYLTVKGVKKCIIPKENGKEVKCREFFVTSRDTGEDALIYINIKTLEEEDILILLYSDNGTFVK